MRSKSGVIGNRPIDNLIEQRRAYERLKAKNAKIRSNIASVGSELKQNGSNTNKIDANIDVLAVEQAQEEVKNKSHYKHRKHKHGHSHKYRSGYTHSSKKR
jgi:hypothetical protein